MPIAMQENYYPAKNEKGVVGRFDYAEIDDIAASNAKGEIVKKLIPVLIARTHVSADFQPTKVPSDPIARKAMIDRFPEAWLEFQGNMPEVPGTPLDQPFHGLTMNRQEQAKMALNGVMSWEQIAEFSDASCSHIGFGTVALREKVMLAMGRTPPGKPPEMKLSEHMTAEQALRQMPGGDELADRLNKMIAEKQAVERGEPLPAAPVQTMPDLAHPMVQAAIQAAVQAALAAVKPAGATVDGADSSPASETGTAPGAPAGKRLGWPKGKPRGPRKARAVEAPVSDAA